MKTTESGSVLRDESVGAAEDSLHVRPAAGRRLAGIALVGYVGLLGMFGVLGRRHGPGTALPAFELQYLLQPLDWIRVVAADGLVEVAKFLPLGFLLLLTFGRRADGCGFPAALARRLLVLLVGIGLSAGVCGLTSGRLVGAVFLLLPLAGFLLGAWFGSAWMRGYRALLWLVPKLGLLLLLAAGGGAGLVVLALDDAPLAFEATHVTSKEKRRVVDILRNRVEREDGTYRLLLSARDVNSLLVIAISQSPLEGKVKVAIDEGGFAGELSLKTPFWASRFRYLNLDGACRLEVTAGRLDVGLKRLQVGRLRIPKFVLDVGVPPLVSILLDDPDLGRGVTLIDSLQLHPGAGDIVYRSGGYGRNNVSSLFAKLGRKPNTLLETGIYIRHLVSAAETLAEGDQRFAAFLQTAFALAHRRSRSRDPVLENRGAILALAILLGHSRVETLVGPVTNKELRKAARRHVGRVTLRGRRDWTKHFFVSAGLALLSNGDMSDGVGLFKEELDSAEGGSGFSFADLLADRAGTEFARAATRDAASARTMQTRLAAGFSVSDLFPQAADLPEGIPDADLQLYYDRVGGARYQQVIAEIEKRLATCSLLHAESLVNKPQPQGRRTTDLPPSEAPH